MMCALGTKRIAGLAAGCAVACVLAIGTVSRLAVALPSVAASAFTPWAGFVAAVTLPSSPA